VPSITLNGSVITVDEGRPLVEVIKEQGISITNLCYIDGLEPYAGCRTCIVEIEGGRPTSLQLSCTAVTTDGMVVNTDSDEIKRTRQSVMSMILANHPDRCLTCHRRVHCMPGDICLRDDVVTHRCLTCSKNYRCELQTSCEIVDMGDFDEPWVGESRSYYETPPPEPDRGNPYLEFDPQMCIICTRCVRACDEIRHTGAVTLSGKGHTTQIAFGTGTQIHESDCNFCGACIDVCPTATLMEKPNKWKGLAEDWTNSACNGCSVGCTITYGLSNDNPVIVKPDRINPVSRDQICVKARFGYTDVSEKDRLTRSLIREQDKLIPSSIENALDKAANSLKEIQQKYGPQSIAVLGSPLNTNEESFLLQKLAREVIKTENLDFSHGAIHRSISAKWEASFGTQKLPGDLSNIEKAKTIVIVGGNVEESHQIVSLRVKDAVTKNGAKLILISNLWSELVSFAEVWLQPQAGFEPHVIDALTKFLEGTPYDISGYVDNKNFKKAASLLKEIKILEDNNLSIIYAPTAVYGETFAEMEAAAIANLSITIQDKSAANNIYYLPTESNVNGLSDVNLSPGVNGLQFSEIIDGINNGSIRALIIHADNPLLSSPGAQEIEKALDSLEVLIVIDSLLSTSAQKASVVLAELPFHAKNGTLTTADHRIIRHKPAAVKNYEEQSSIFWITELAKLLGTDFGVNSESQIMDVIASEISGYVSYEDLAKNPGRVRALENVPSRSDKISMNLELAMHTGGLAILTGKSLYTSWNGASIKATDADKLGRELFMLVHPEDAEPLGIKSGSTAIIDVNDRELHIAVQFDDGITPGSIYIPQYYDGGALMQILPLKMTFPVKAKLKVPQAI
tara:strand:+ start:9151 stop:11706 length:2556 start_codon:yes stop_codon:yes gene_type:complete